MFSHIPSIATVSLSGTLGEKLAAISTAGFRTVELCDPDLLAYPGTRQDVRTLCSRAGLEVITYGTCRELSRLSRKLECARDLGAPLLLLESTVGGDTDALRAAADAAQRLGIRIAYEAVPWADKVATWQAAWEVAKAVAHPAFGLCLDSFNVLCLGDDASGIARIPKEMIFHVQMADAPLLKMDSRSYSRHHRNFPLQGGLPVVEFLETLRETGYGGPLSLEVHNDFIRTAVPQKIAVDGYRSLCFLQSKVYGDELLPPVPEIEGVDFVEFVVEKRCEAGLESFFLDLGLKEVGRHKTADMRVFSNGQVVMILNADSESRAAAHLILHDCWVSSIGVRVKDVNAMAERARTLGCDVGGTGTCQISIETPDGTFMHLIDGTEAWKTHFIFKTDIDYTPPHYGRVDHIAQALDGQSMDRLVLFYKSVFGMVQQQLFELQDPLGLTKSLAVVSPNHALRFPLNISEEKDTNIGRLVREASGSMVHHIAFETNDIFGVVESLRKHARRDRFLRVPRSYYDDLAARYTDLPADFVAQMRAYNIMYDCDEKGEFLHLSTAQFGNLFFFEICQRGAGYTHFASINAPIRMSILHERRNLASRVAVYGVDEKRRSSSGAVDVPDIAAVYPAGCESLLALIGEILGKQSSDDPTSSVGVIGVPAASATAVLPTVPSRYLTVNLHNIDSNLPIDNAVSAHCAHEYIFSSSDFSRRDLTRFISFITGQKSSHSIILSKSRSTFLALTFPDIRPALANLDILTIGADAIELRVDMLREGPSTSPYNPIPRLEYIGHQLLLLRQRTELPIIFTVRSVAEGGRCLTADPKITHDLLKKGLQWGADYIDVEIQLPEPIRTSLATSKRHTRILAAYHDLLGTLKWASRDALRLYHTARSYGDITKIVGFAREARDNYELEFFRSRINDSFGHPLLAINASQIGQLSRIMNPFFTPITHPLLPVSAAPGQLSAAEINQALKITGQLPGAKTIFTINDARAQGFWSKCINELALPHSYAALEPLAPPQLAALTRQSCFGGALIRPAIAGCPEFVDELSDTAKDVAAVDTIVARSCGLQTVLVGHHSGAVALRRCLTSVLSPVAFRSAAGVVVGMDAAGAAAAVWALRSLGAAVYTVGFKAAGTKGWESGVKGVRAVVSVLGKEKKGLIKPLLGMVGSGGVVIGGEGAEGWEVIEWEEVEARRTERALEVLVGVRVGWQFVGGFSGNGGF